MLLVVLDKKQHAHPNFCASRRLMTHHAAQSDVIIAAMAFFICGEAFNSWTTRKVINLRSRRASLISK
jgi:hypothetical protein